jgi:hypothetical protein
MLASSGQRGAQRNQGRGQSFHQPRGDGNLLAGANQFSTSAERESIVERHTHHGVGALPALDDDLVQLVFFARQRSDPVIENSAPFRTTRISSWKHGGPRYAQDYTIGFRGSGFRPSPGIYFR